jgi:hypothetical protein
MIMVITIALMVTADIFVFSEFITYSFLYQPQGARHVLDIRNGYKGQTCPASPHNGICMTMKNEREYLIEA